MVYVVCIIIGIVTAFVGGLMGLGGGIVLIPSMLFLYQFSDAFSWATPQVIVGISLVAMIFTGLSSSIAYFKSGRIDYKTGLYFLSGSVPGSVVGSWLNQFVNPDEFQLYFGFIMILISMLFFMKKQSKTPQQMENKKNLRSFTLHGETYRYAVNVYLAFFLALLVGIMSGLFGIGGGSIMVPAMILLFGIPVHIATATSMFMIFFVSIIGASTHIALGHVIWQYALFFIPGAWIGGKIGAIVNQRLNGNTLEWILRAILIIIGIRMIVEGIA